MARATEARTSARARASPQDRPGAAARDRIVEGPDGIRFIQPIVRPIEKATDLGSVQVLKHENLFLLTDQFGDIHPDSRGLGLYLNDSRIVSCSAIRVGGVRPVLLQGSMGGNFRGTIHLTNPSIDRNLRQKIRPTDALASRKLGISRERLLSNGALQERFLVVNHSEHDEDVDIDLELADDCADIFEVRGYPRPARGTNLPIAVTDRRVTFRYDGLDGKRRSTHFVFSEAPQDAGPAVSTDHHEPDGWIHLRWSFRLKPGARHQLTWIVWADVAPPRADENLFPDPPRVSVDDGLGAYHAWARGT